VFMDSHSVILSKVMLVTTMTTQLHSNMIIGEMLSTQTRIGEPTNAARQLERNPDLHVRGR
jgi:hypothetical protein